MFRDLFCDLVDYDRDDQDLELDDQYLEPDDQDLELDDQDLERDGRDDQDLELDCLDLDKFDTSWKIFDTYLIQAGPARPVYIFDTYSIQAGPGRPKPGPARARPPAWAGLAPGRAVS